MKSGTRTKQISQEFISNAAPKQLFLAYAHLNTRYNGTYNTKTFSL